MMPSSAMALTDIPSILFFREEDIQYDVAAGHDHDGTNSRLITAPTRTTLVPAMNRLSIVANSDTYANYSGESATEAHVQVQLPACTIKRVSIYVSQVLANSTVDVRIDGVDTGIGIALTPGQTGQRVGYGSVAVGAGGLLSIHITAGAGPGGIVIENGAISIEV